MAKFFLLLLLLFTNSCNYLDAIPGASSSINESRKRGVFVKKLLIKKNFYFGGISINNAWIERRWSYKGLSTNSTNIFSLSDNYLNLNIETSILQGDTLLIETTHNEILHGTSKNIFTTIKKPVTGFLCIKKSVAGTMLKDSCLLIIK